MGVLFSVNDGIAVIEFDYPEKLNTFDKAMLEGINDVVCDIESDDSVKVVIFVGKGKAFSAGANIEEMASLNEEESKSWVCFGNSLFRRIECLRIPTIAAINGYAFGGGLELALSCDMRFASEKAKMGLPEVSLGIISGYGGTQRLPRIVGEATAKKLIYTGQTIDAGNAQKIGLVQDVYEHDELMSRVTEIATTICNNSFPAIVNAKKAINYAMVSNIDDGLNTEIELFGQLFNTSEQKERMEVFILRGKK